jgi:hypothetical protein
MKVEIKDTFFESVEKLIWYDTKLWKVWEFIRRGIPTFFGNIWRFRKELYSHQWWDYRFTLEMLYRSISIMEKGISERGIEVDGSRGKKVEAMRRVLELLKHKLDDDYIERAEEKFGSLNLREWEFEAIEGSDGYRLVDNDTPQEKAHHRKIFNYAKRLEDKEWREIWGIIKGNQNDSDWKKIIKSLTPEERYSHDVYTKWFNGSDMRGWWD